VALRFGISFVLLCSFGQTSEALDAFGTLFSFLSWRNPDGIDGGTAHDTRRSFNTPVAL
jgi:hypothetical protein